MAQTQRLDRPSTTPHPDVAKATALKRMKNIALGLLIFMAVVFCFAFALQQQFPWLAYVRAAAEGGMVGALADWFAVTALFKYPMGLKIPHTAIIPNRKDEIGASLGDFVETNFLSEDVISQKLATTQIAQKVGQWLSKPASAQRVATEGAAALRGAIEVLKDDDVKDVIESMVRKHLLDPPWGPPIGKVAERIFAEGHHHALVDLLVDRSTTWVRSNHTTISGLVTDRSPSWVPQFVDGLVGDKIYTEIYKFARAVQDDPRHEVRLQLDNYLQQLAQELQHDPAMIAKAESIKAQVLGDPEVRELAGKTWDTIKTALTTAVEDPTSELRLKFTGVVQEFGTRLVEDAELAQKANTWIANAASYLVGTYKHEITSLITDTVARWDAEETSQKIELQVGKDLQFIRINGTVVGSLAGLAIFTVATLVFG
ncbi:DUF445 domain-containing protein [Arthrobacter psychrolactophilus]|uniref:DUF445 domain-containing protein n=1 Tax=Arthrobacter psychrolactophilus TaxID=92442 RepID=A0A2V5IVN1_9MICC|nr:DUF445 domain-containing protein [Arthrobacter psychrolactophilus]PYI40101.1 DUF445 domain-containing protein [Arthrobacter psychrolactophilus]